MSMLHDEGKKEFRHIDLRLVIPDYTSDLTDLIMELDYLRKLRVSGTTPHQTFFQIKRIFHILESIGSARIEGNRTTVVEYIDNKLERSPDTPNSIREIENMEAALSFIDENISSQPINRALISELHKMVVAGLTVEGSSTPGEYRNLPVSIEGSSLAPPPFVSVPAYMDELFDFVAKNDPPKYDLLKIALAHHRFVWIHPFDNGNGRTVRLLTYAMLVKFGFRVHFARILNPTAIFCCDREKYYHALARADMGDDEGYLKWSHFVLFGLKQELEKTDRLADYDYLKDNVLKPAIKYSLEKNILNEDEAKILCLAVDKVEIANSDIKAILNLKHTADVSRIIRVLLKNKFLVPTEKNSRKYSIDFRENKLRRGIVHALAEAGFLPD